MKIPSITEKANTFQRIKMFFCKHQNLKDVSTSNYRIRGVRVNYYCLECGIKKLSNLFR